MMNFTMSLKDKIKDSNKFSSVTRIGDCLAPATIASAVYDGRKYAMEFDDDSSETYLNKRDSNF